MIVQELISDEEHCCTPTQRKNNRQYQREGLSAVCVYFVTLFVSIGFVDRIPPGIVKVTVALLPMIGVLGMSAALVRFIARLDEFQRQGFITAGAIAGLVTAVLTMTLGFLENAGLPPVPMTFVWPCTMLVFGGCAVFILRRYR
jgi:hypothetical protein